MMVVTYYDGIDLQFTRKRSRIGKTSETVEGSCLIAGLSRPNTLMDDNSGDIVLYAMVSAMCWRDAESRWNT
jgi:hypothetical protein